MFNSIEVNESINSSNSNDNKEIRENKDNKEIKGLKIKRSKFIKKVFIEYLKDKERRITC